MEVLYYGYFEGGVSLKPYSIWAPAKTSDILEQLHQDIDTWYHHETLRNDRGDTKNDDSWYTCSPDFIANIKSSGTMRDTQKTMTISATSFRGCNRFSPLLIYIYIWTAAYKKYSYRRYKSITLDASHSLQSLPKVVGGIHDELRKEWIGFGTTHNAMELVSGILIVIHFNIYIYIHKCGKGCQSLICFASRPSWNTCAMRTCAFEGSWRRQCVRPCGFLLVLALKSFSTFEGQPPKTRPLPIKTTVIWDAGTFMWISKCFKHR